MMKLPEILACASALVLLSACGEEAAHSKPAEAARQAGVHTDVPEVKLADKDALFKYLVSKDYKQFPVSEPAIHRSVGPHDFVRVYYNEKAANSIRAGNAEHPVGSMIVKELYKSADADIYGWAVSIKTEAKGDGGLGWYWYEVVSTTDPTKLYPDNPGNGIPECAGCHVIGPDSVRSVLPQ